MSDRPRAADAVSDAQETQTAEPLSPTGIAAMQGLEADIAQAEEVKKEALAAHNLKIAREANQALTHLRLEQLKGQPGSRLLEPRSPALSARDGAGSDSAGFRPGNTAERPAMTEGELLQEKPSREKPITPKGPASGNPEHGG